MTDRAEAKAIARKAAFAARKAAGNAADEARANTHIAQYLAGERAKVIAGYMPIRSEISPLAAMAALAPKAHIGVPVIVGAGQPLIFQKWHADAEMVDGPYGAQVPARGVDVVPDVVIVPLLAFNARLHRLGYGGGFYDRTLEQLRAAGPTLAVGFAFAGQMVDHLPTDPTDQPLDAIVTERGILLN